MKEWFLPFALTAGIALGFCLGEEISKKTMEIQSTKIVALTEAYNLKFQECVIKPIPKRKRK